ncbi:MAG: hypothetical protein PF542_03970 [Nanoarchaeota archaeon]|jgi:malate/lactate dehydrogenase|nr:hypothetical protein [Nanoarchaeota archaeon]
MNVLVVGAGGTGEEIIRNLLKIERVSKIFIFNRSINSSKALKFKLKSLKIVPFENLNELKSLDYVILTLSGMSVASRHLSIKKVSNTFDLRQEELKYNLGGIVEMLPFFRRMPTKTKIVVVTNPVDEIANFLKTILPKREIFGFGLQLDVKRYSDLLGKKVSCIGMHGKAIPLLGLKSSLEYDAVSKKVDSILFEKVRKSGIPHKFAGEEFGKYFNFIIGDKAEKVYTSYYLKKSFHGVKDISISLPYIVKSGKIVGIENIKLSKLEIMKLKKDVKELKFSVDRLLNAYKGLVAYE